MDPATKNRAAAASGTLLVAAEMPLSATLTTAPTKDGPTRADGGRRCQVPPLLSAGPGCSSTRLGTPAPCRLASEPGERGEPVEARVLVRGVLVQGRVSSVPQCQACQVGHCSGQCCA